MNNKEDLVFGLFLLVVVFVFVTGILLELKRQDEVIQQEQPIHFVVYCEDNTIESTIERLAEKHGVPVTIVNTLIEIESQWDSMAVGSVGEIGLMQIRPSTARWMGYSGTHEDLHRVETNLDVGMRYLSYLKGRYGDWSAAVAAYNMGPTALDRRDGIPYVSTQQYVDSIIQSHFDTTGGNE